jgi:hypothetical protein
VLTGADPQPTVRIRQGEAPALWLLTGPVPESRPVRPPLGAVLWGGLGGLHLRYPDEDSCGDITTCEWTRVKTSFQLGADYWIMPWVAASVGYIRPAVLKVNGADAGFRFFDERDLEIVTLTGKAAVRSGRARVYAYGGVNRHHQVFTMEQVINDQTVDVNGVPQTITGGTDTFAIETTGWGFTFGGGFEVWLKPWLGVYSDVGVSRLKGSDVRGGEGTVYDVSIYGFIGGRLRLGRGEP